MKLWGRDDEVPIAKHTTVVSEVVVMHGPDSQIGFVNHCQSLPVAFASVLTVMIQSSTCTPRAIRGFRETI